MKAKMDSPPVYIGLSKELLNCYILYEKSTFTQIWTLPPRLAKFRCSAASLRTQILREQMCRDQLKRPQQAK